MATTHRSIMIQPSPLRFVTGLPFVLALLTNPVPAQDVACSPKRAASGDRAQLAACRALVKREPDNSTGWQGLGSALAQAGNFAEAAHAWRQYIRLKPEGAEGYHNLGLMYEFVRQPDSALAAFERALVLEAGDPRMLQTLAWHIGVQHANSGRQELALSWFREAAALDSADASAWHYAALAAARLGRHTEAMGLWTRALGLAPELLAQVQPAQRTFYDRSRQAVGAQPPAPVVSPGVLEGARRRPQN